MGIKINRIYKKRNQLKFYIEAYENGLSFSGLNIVDKGGKMFIY